MFTCYYSYYFFVKKKTTKRSTLIWKGWIIQQILLLLLFVDDRRETLRLFGDRELNDVNLFVVFEWMNEPSRVVDRVWETSFLFLNYVFWVSSSSNNNNDKNYEIRLTSNFLDAELRIASHLLKSLLPTSWHFNPLFRSAIFKNIF